MKQLLASILVVLLLTATMPGVMATSTDDGIIAITGAVGGEGVAGKTFALYKVFEATKGTGSAVSYQWYIPSGDKSPYYDFFYGADGIIEANQSDGSQEKVMEYIRSLKDDASALSLFANNLYQYIKTNGIEATATQTAAATATEVRFEDLEYGYYLIYDATEGAEVKAAVTLTSAIPTSTVQLKIDKPSINKTINGEVTKASSATIGDTVSYTIAALVPDMTAYQTYTYKISDDVPAGMTLNQDTITISKNGVAMVKDTDYSITVDEDGFEITYKQVKSYNKGDKLTITYTAVVNDQADVEKHCVNTATLTYSNDPTDSTSLGTATSSADIHTYYLQLTKVASTNISTTLNGAKFKLYRVNGSGEAVALNLESTGTAGEYKVKQISTGGSANDLEMDVADNGNLTIYGLGAGDYRLEETESPDGYKLPQHSFDFTITERFSSDGTNKLTDLNVVNIATENTEEDLIDPKGTIVTTDSGNDMGYATFKVINAVGTALPETGGAGTTMIILAGIILIVAGLALIVIKKKSNL